MRKTSAYPIIACNFSHFTSRTYVMGTQKNCLGEVVPLSTQNTYIYIYTLIYISSLMTFNGLTTTT